MSTTSNVFTSTGTSFALVAALPATYDQAGFEALTFVDVAEVTDLGEFGAVYNKVDHSALERRNIVKRKSMVDYGSVSVQLGRDPSDAGQALLIAGADGVSRDDVFSISVTLQDGSVSYFTSQIYSYTTNVGAGDQIVGSTVQLEIDNEIIEVAAA